MHLRYASADAPAHQQMPAPFKRKWLPERAFLYGKQMAVVDSGASGGDCQARLRRWDIRGNAAVLYR